MTERQKYVLHYYFEWTGGCLWSGCDASSRDFGVGPLDEADFQLPLSSEIRQRCQELGEWHDTALNWDYPPDPGPWRQPECDRFNSAARALLADLRQELGEQFEIIDKQDELVEDPNLDAFLKNPDWVRRLNGFALPKTLSFFPDMILSGYIGEGHCAFPASPLTKESSIDPR
ncbi:MAG TPA: hypothetical protein VGJ26_16555 [Pirellulales bacterium]|jgi:hypothetical protein